MLTFAVFQFILNFLYKVLSGQLKEMEDTREDEVIEKLKHTANGKPNGNARASSNGHTTNHSGGE